MKPKIFLAAALIIPVTLALVVVNNQPESSPKEKNWKIKIAPDNEPGERMIVTGTVYDEDGKTPLENVELYIYHTDIKGIYGENRQHRLNGTIFTNKDGKYEYNTVKPGSYPDGRVPAHVHYEVKGKNIPEQQFELRFEGDLYLFSKDVEEEKQKKNFAEIQKLVKGDDNILRCRMDIKIMR